LLPWDATLGRNLELTTSDVRIIGLGPRKCKKRGPVSQNIEIAAETTGELGPKNEWEQSMRLMRCTESDVLAGDIDPLD